MFAFEMWCRAADTKDLFSVRTKQRQERNSEMKDSGVAGVVAADPVKSCSNQIWYDRRNLRSIMCVKMCTGKHRDTCPILSLVLLCCFPQGIQSPVLELADIFRRTLWHAVISALLSPCSLAIICQNFDILLFCVYLLGLRAHQDYKWDMSK